MCMSYELCSRATLKMLKKTSCMGAAVGRFAWFLENGQQSNTKRLRAVSGNVPTDFAQSTHPLCFLSTRVQVKKKKRP